MKILSTVPKGFCCQRALTLFLALALPASLRAQQPTGSSLAHIPSPFETIKDKREFNAVQFGPGNSFSVAKTPPDFHLNAFAIGGDGRLLAMGWESGRIEIWDIQTKKRISEFKSGIGSPIFLDFNAQNKELLIVGREGKIVFLELPNGKKSKSLTIPLGKYKYDVQQVVLDPGGKWLAYADEESSKVLDITSDPPRQIADLKDAGSLCLSQDGTSLWTVNRTELTSLNVGNWQLVGNWPLKSPAIQTAPTLVRSGVSPEGKQTAAVPSSKGLIIYTAPEMTAEYATDQPTSAVAFAPGKNTFVNLSRQISFFTGAGKLLCSKSYENRVGVDISGDGQWLAISQFNKIDLWRMEDLLRDCSVAQ
jgi:WD40 repeat protein